MTLEWNLDMSAAPHGRSILLFLGETIPEMPDIRVGGFVGPREAEALEGEEGIFPDGGWLIWNSADDWFVIGLNWPMAWCPAELPKMSPRAAA